MKKYFFMMMLTFVFNQVNATNHTEFIEDSTRVKDIEEIVIISTPKETNKLRQIPISVSLFDETTLSNNHTTSLKELSQFVPNFFMPDYGSGLTSAAYIRGVGSRINTPAIGLYVDNVGYADKSAYDIELLDVERIDVLRGPQATLYGRNSMGGILRVFTRNPFRYQGTDLKMGTSIKDNGYNISLSHYQKINNHLAFSVTGFYKNSDGFYKNITRNETVGGKEVSGGRARIIWMPNESWKFDFTTDYSYRVDNGYPYRYLGEENPSKEEMTEYIGRIIYNEPSFYRRSLFNAGLNAQYNAERYVMSSVTAYQNLNDNMTMDQDFIDKSFFTLSQKQRINSWSEELTFKSRYNKKWEWIGGMYALYQANRTKSPVSLTDRFMNTVFDAANQAMQSKGMSLEMNMHQSPFVADGFFETPTIDIAAFHQSTFNHIFGVEGLSVSAGIRLEYEILKLKHNYGGQMDYDILLNSPMMPLSLKNISDKVNLEGQLNRDYLQWLPKVAIQYNFNNKNNIYASWSKGYRSGGYNIQMFSDLVQGEMRSKMMTSTQTKTKEEFEKTMYNRMPEAVKQMIVNQIPQESFTGQPEQTFYKPEYSYNYEVGGHFSFLDDKVQMDAAVFYMDIYDQQISKFVSSGLGRVMVNAGRGRSYGAEMSWKGSLLDNRITWNASYGYTNAQFKEYEVQTADESAQQDAINYNGNAVPFVPKHTMAVGLDYYQPLKRHHAVKGLFVGINSTGAGDIYWGEDNKYKQPFYALLNAHMGIDFGAVQVNVWGKNLTDTNYDVFFFTSAATTRNLKFAQCGNPLQFGIDLSLHF